VQVLYALALVPVGFLADKADRPRLLAGGLVVWSVLTMVASKVNLSCFVAPYGCLTPERTLILCMPLILAAGSVLKTVASKVKPSCFVPLLQRPKKKR
jgi:hypothetical protein